MKFYGFEEVTYPGLDPHIGPEERITNRLCSPALVVQHYQEHLELLARSEELGFEGVFFNEHHFTAGSNAPDCNVMAAALIARTKTLRIGVIGNVIALRHPLAVAEAFAMLDCLSNGRFIPGIVRGVPQEWVAYNMDPLTSRQRFTEAYRITHRALSEEIVDYEGDFWNIAQASIWPKPVQDPFPSFWMPAGSMESIRFAAENRLVACQTLQPTSVFQQCFSEYRRIANEEFGWSPGPDKITGVRFVHIDEDQAKAEEEGLAMFRYFMLCVGRPVVNPAPLPGFNTDQSYKHRKANPNDVFGLGDPSAVGRKGVDEDKNARSATDAAEIAKFREGGMVLAGRPEFVAEWLAEDARASGYGNLVVSFRIGNASHAQSMKSQELFTKHVMPVLRPINSEIGAEGESKRTIVAGIVPKKLEYFGNSNYILSPDAIEARRPTRQQSDTHVTHSWNLQVAEIAEDGSPTQIIVPGPSTNHIGCAIKVYLTTEEGSEVGDDADIIFETASPTGHNRQVLFEGKYGDFRRAADHTLPAQSRGVAENDYYIRLAVRVRTAELQPDLDNGESAFQVRCFKHLMTVSA